MTERLAAALEVQGFLVALLPEERLQRTARLLPAGGGQHHAPSRSTSPSPRAPPTARVIAQLDGRFASRRPWTGIVTVDTLLHEGVPVLRVVPGSPAAAAGMQPGDVLLARATGKPVKRTAELLAAVAARSRATS